MIRRLWPLLLVVVAMAPACGKKTTRVAVPVGYAEARSATPEELVSLVNQRYSLESLTVSRMSIEFTGGSLETGYLEEFPRAKGHLVAQRPDAVYVNILNPVTNSTVVAMAARSGRFQIWVPRENKYLVGSTSLPADGENPLYSVRPDHLLEAVLLEPIPLDSPEWLYFVEEEQDARNKYYVLSVVRLTETGPGCLERKLWFERRELSLSRQNLYDCGTLESRTDYAAPVDLGDNRVSSRIELERLPEHYTLKLNLEAETIRVGRILEESAFAVPMPPGAELVEVKPE